MAVASYGNGWQSGDRVLCVGDSIVTSRLIRYILSEG